MCTNVLIEDTNVGHIGSEMNIIVHSGTTKVKIC